MVHESNIDWEFDGEYLVYDQWTWYRKHFNGCAESAAIDFVILEEDVAWLLEVKDFTTTPPDPQKGPLYEIVARKVRDTLAGLLAGSVNASDAKQVFAQNVLRADKLRVVFHCELPANRKRLFPPQLTLSDLKQKLRKAVRAIDPHALVVDCNTTSSVQVPWTATWKP